MSNVLYYYAKINENGVCYGFETLAKKYKQEDLPSNLVPLVDCNETVLWKKWQGKDMGWSMESYEPSIDTILQDKIEELENENQQLKQQIQDLLQEKELSKQEIAGLQLSIAEISMMITTP